MWHSVMRIFITGSHGGRVACSPAVQLLEKRAYRDHHASRYLLLSSKFLFACQCWSRHLHLHDLSQGDKSCKCTAPSGDASTALTTSARSAHIVPMSFGSARPPTRPTGYVFASRPQTSTLSPPPLHSVTRHFHALGCISSVSRVSGPHRRRLPLHCQ
jgi:hypothetical protein